MSVLNKRSSGSIGSVFSIVRLLSNNKKGLKICHINAQSLGDGKVDEFRYIFEYSSEDLMCISETLFKPQISDNLYQLNGYNIVRVDRLSHDGGVAIFIESSIQYKIVKKSAHDWSMECIFIEKVKC